MSSQRKHNNKRGSQRSRSQSTATVVGLERRLCPPPYQSNVRFSHTYRFVSTSSTTTSITPTSLLLMAGTYCDVANSTVISMFSSLKVNRISIWSPPASQGAATTCSLSFYSNTNSPNIEHSDTSVSTAQPAYFTCRPPPQSLAGFWLTTSTQAIMAITAPTGSVIDVSVSLVLSDDDSYTTAAVTTATLGSIYYLSLDPNATHRFVPVSLTTTT
jgi:hypothetical protein